MTDDAGNLKKTNSTRQAFTLVELLVVIALIAVLTALLLPALKSAKGRAKTAKCANNERQFAVGLFGYLADHNEYYPWVIPECDMCTAYTNPPYSFNCNPGTTPACGYCDAWGQCWRPFYAGGSCSGGNWYQALYPYMGLDGAQYADPKSTLNQVVRCAAQPSNWTFPGNGGNTYLTYSINSDLFPISGRSSQNTYANCGGPTAGYTSPFSATAWSKRARSTDINHTSAAMFMGESPVDGSLQNVFSQAKPGTYYYGLPIYYSTYIEAYMVTNVFYMNNPYNPVNWSIGGPYPFDWPTPDYNGNIAMFHNQGMNVLFCDGHVERISKRTLMTYTCQLYDPTDTHNWLTGQGPLQSAGKDTPGGIFWCDGKYVPGVDSNWGIYAGQWTWYQFPGAPLQN